MTDIVDFDNFIATIGIEQQLRSILPNLLLTDGESVVIMQLNGPQPGLSWPQGQAHTVKEIEEP